MLSLGSRFISNYGLVSINTCSVLMVPKENASHLAI